MAYTTIDKGSSYFNTVLWTGNNSSPRNIDTGHATDFVWVKFRTSAFNHRLFDIVRGGSKKLISNNTDAEDTGAVNDVTAFISNGFTIGANINSSADGGLVGWSWKANGAGVSNTSGSISSTVSANTTSGFSIVSYTGNGTAGATVGHGLGVAPKMIIVKYRDSSSYEWLIQHASIGNTVALFFNTASTSASSTYWNNTSPTSSVFTLGSSSALNNNTGTFIAYCFAEVKGFSKAFSYTGNGSSDGTFIYTGMRPAFIITKRTDTTSQWQLLDNKRLGYNPSNSELYADSLEVENTVTKLDILSNGFKLRTTSTTQNASGGTYIGFAFAENPFVSSKGIPCTAR